MRTEIETRGAIALERSRAMDYLTLTKPELTFLSVLTALVGYYLGAGGVLHGTGLFHILFGTSLVGAGAGTLNQVIERRYDALMKRTENRPIPSGRISLPEAIAFGSVLSVLGIADLVLFVNPLTAFIGAVTSVTYLSLYTPLKRISPLSTLVGGIPGALPPVMGWAAARNEVGMEAWILFGILFFWQMPHFLSLSWMYRRDYAKAGFRLLSVTDPDGGKSFRQIMLFTIGLLPVSLLLTAFGSLGSIYASGAVLLGAGFVIPTVLLSAAKSNTAARTVFIASLCYLPALMLAMVLDKLLM